MPLGEFDIIDRYFRRPLAGRDDVAIGTATLAAEDWRARDGEGARLGHDAMALALEPLVAGGARPVWATLALTLPEPDADWLQAFSEALLAAAATHGVVLVGGDTTRGPFTVTVIGHGLRSPEPGAPP